MDWAGRPAACCRSAKRKETFTMPKAGYRKRSISRARSPNSGTTNMSGPGPSSIMKKTRALRPKAIGYQIEASFELAALETVKSIDDVLIFRILFLKKGKTSPLLQRWVVAQGSARTEQDYEQKSFVWSDGLGKASACRKLQGQCVGKKLRGLGQFTGAVFPQQGGQNSL